MSDSIKKQTAINALEQLKKDISEDYTYADPLVMAGTAYINDCIKVLLELPSEESEIIRCKDCKYGSPNGEYGCKSYHYKLYEAHEMKPDDFCSFAERRTDE